MKVRKEWMKIAACVALCAVLLAGNAMNTWAGNVTYCGNLEVETHLQSRAGYSRANYAVYITAPSDVVGIQINGGEIKKGNVTYLYGGVSEVRPGDFGKLTAKVTVYYADGHMYSSQVTTDLNHRCGGTHPLTDRCMP